MDYHKYSGSLSDLLLQIYQEKKKNNPRFSMNSFARKVGILPSRFSEVISGKRNLTLAAAQKLALSLKLLPHEKKFFLIWFIHRKI